MTGVELIAAERRRQIEDEGWDAEHDDTHDDFELLAAARCYTQAAWRRRQTGRVPIAWPWQSSWWKPSDDPIRNLVKAGALIAAEIDRLKRRRDTTQEKT